MVGLNPNLERVYISYLDSFERIRKFPTINTLSDNEQFCEVLKNLLKDHWGTIPRMMIGLLESSIHLPAAARERFITVRLSSSTLCYSVLYADLSICNSSACFVHG